MNKNSKLMDFFLKLGLEKLAWSFRRLHCPVDKDALVLEVGSGGNPYFRSNVLIDGYFETRERHFEPLISDRPTVIGFVENLPFKNDSFDFVIASHVLEHSEDPVKFLSEIQRVAKSGYIEVPDAFFERLACYLDHKLEITDIHDELIIRKKKNYIEDQEVESLFSNKVKPVFGNIASTYPFKFNVRFFWSKNTGGIKYKVVNPEYEFDWKSPETNEFSLRPNLKGRFKSSILNVIRKYFSQNRRNKNIDLKKVLMCPKCKESDFSNINAAYLNCLSCSETYGIIGNGVIRFD